MTDAAVMEIGMQALWLSIKIGAPILLVGLSVGLFIGLIQAVTQVQEVTLTFVPKFIGTVIVFAVGGNWMLQEIVTFTRSLFASIPSLLS